MDNKVLIILGMHRSGTSLIAQWLHKCGLQLGDRLMGAGIGNDEGHFEDLDFVSLHESFFVDAGLPASGIMLEPVPELSAYYLEKFKSNIALKHKLHFQWGWKDPRTCLLLPVYNALIPEAKYIIVFRDTECVVNSLILREFKLFEKRYLKNANRFKKALWQIKRKKVKEHLYKTNTDVFYQISITYNTSILNHLKTMNSDRYLVVNYKAIINNSEEIFNYISTAWDLSLSYVEFEKIFNQKMISPVAEMNKYLSDKNLQIKAEKISKEFANYQNLFTEK